MATKKTHGEGNRARNGRFTRTPDTAARDATAVRMRVEGASVEEIAATLGYANKGSATKAIQRALADVSRPDVEQLRALQGAELDAIQRTAWEIIRTPHYKVSNSGRIVTDPATGEPMMDPAPVVGALGVLLRVRERRAKLLGLNAPDRSQVDMTVTPAEAAENLKAEIARMRAQQAELERIETAQLPPGHPERLG